MSVEDEVCEYLNGIGVAFQRLDHERVSSMEECKIVEARLGGVVARNLFLTTTPRNAYYLLLAHPESAFRTSIVSRQAGSSRLSFADESDVKRLLNAHAGAISPFGLIYDTQKRVGLLIDKKLYKEEYWVFHPLENTSSVKLKRDDFLNVFLTSLGRAAIAVDMGG